MLVIPNSQGSNAMAHPGGTDNLRTFNDANVLPTDAAPIVWKFDYFWDGDTTGNKRLTMGLRDDGNGNPLGALLELGYYNDAYNPASETDSNIPAGGSGLAYRVAILSGADSTPSQLAGYNGWDLFLNSDATDKRAARLSLTAKGRELYDQVAPKALAMEAEVFAGFSPDERRAFRDMLDRVEAAAAKLDQA